jgi:hypothetical protein
VRFAARAYGCTKDLVDLASLGEIQKEMVCLEAQRRLPRRCMMTKALGRGDMRIRALLFLILLGCYPGPGATLHGGPSYQATADAKVRSAVYVAALEHLAVRANIRYMAINYRTSLFHVPGDTTRELGVMPERASRVIDEQYKSIAQWHAGSDTWDDFRANNVIPQLLEYRLNLSIRFLVIDSVFSRVEYGGVNRGFLPDHPDVDAIVALSGVGLNQTLTEALVAVFVDCGAHCDYTELLRLIRRHGSWVVADELLENWS